MTTDDLSVAASELQFRTYLALGLATAGTTHLQEPGFEGCYGSEDHPICNFAARLKLDPWAANQIQDLALSRNSFNVYSAPGDLPARREVRHEILTRSGFKLAFTLQQMVSDRPPQFEPVPYEMAVGVSARTEAATFMGSQFFAKQSSLFRRRVVDATIGASELELYLVRPQNELVAAHMLVPHGNLVGLFNLCVRPPHQGRGWGTGIVSEIQRLAFEQGRIVTLQCEEQLVAWYSRLGFRSTGVVDAYVLSDDRRIAIMN